MNTQLLKNQIINNAVDVFGSVDEPHTRGYIYEDGDYLPLGGGIDHRVINCAFVFEDDDEHEDIILPDSFPMDRHGTSYFMIAFMKYACAIRYQVSNNYLSASFIEKPTRRQIFSLDEIIKEFGVEEVRISRLNDEYRSLKDYEGYTYDFLFMDQIHSL
jgi:hypothetical protein